MSRYQDAGVDVNAGYELVHRIKAAVKSTARLGVLGGIGSFGGMFDLSKLKVAQPILVSGTDGVGTKLLIAQQMDKHDTIGIDVVAMCANDVLAQGAAPITFLDYIATGHNNPAKMAEIVQGVATGCRQAEAALIGGETAEMPDMYDKDEYDLAGTIVGVAEKEELLTTNGPQKGDILIGLPSSGLHSNGFSLVRQILFKDHHVELGDCPAELGGQSVGATILTPTRIYVRAVLPLIHQKLIHGISHITGGGLIENVPRMLGDNLQAVVDSSRWPKLPIFDYLRILGDLTRDDCFQTFNMGLGMVLAVAPERAAQVQRLLSEQQMPSYQIGYLRHCLPNAEKIVIK
ncbi:phosphoribosylformylglycinamidine cyclo-ligase [Limosilactobacillus sp. RRLNB_1_1]|uniref:Phosphoribosylformylglycinamidine cyclo-ligase n=1 Tax=Limosilactobacillus albertensis TaxID=2759752 RepID=A0A7W3TSR5_9LACO|nr:phosphoribosylformylglycinamidine cyclo-ligase [Limosilactobacillus albertensis]MBB1070144.1 phosphoribosylformylglycinamidine cyclo-ligase [Limosilactobacillus albertensis]MCD7117709.1 phosphoribosylformylglycinamidine cyclo-ligase [Limosilactobacillus albertensis]MCD7128256.1 phosphoribosylformylglycinamidine cyclo-ligase [Limosilactobacillus albertensis]